jgi:hypothetical protein
MATDAAGDQVSKSSKQNAGGLVQHFGTPVMGIELLGCRRYWVRPVCEIGNPGKSVYQMTASGKQARSEGNCGRAKEVREWLGNLTSKPIDHFAVETLRKRLRHLLAMKFSRRQTIRDGKGR